MATPIGFKKRTIEAILAVLLSLGAVLFAGASFPQVSMLPERPLAGFWEPIPKADIQVTKPVRPSHGLERLEALFLAERAVAVSA